MKTFKEASRIIGSIVIIVIAILMLVSCSPRQHTIKPIEEEVQTPEPLDVTFHVIDSIYTIGAINLITPVDIDRVDRDIKYVLYKDALATDTFCYHNSIKEMQYTLKDLQEYLIYMYEDNNPIAFKLR